MNWYVYCENNPIIYFDFWGLFTETKIMNTPENQHEDVNVPLRDMFDMHKKSINDYIDLVDGGVKVNLNGKSQIYYYNTEIHEQVDDNWMYNGKMIVNAVDFAMRFELGEITSDSGTQNYIFTFIDVVPRFRTAIFDWDFSIWYVKSPIGNIVYYQQISVKMDAWIEILDNIPNFVANNWVSYLDNDNNVVKKTSLYAHEYDFKWGEKPSKTITTINYSSHTNIVLPEEAIKATIRFSAVYDINIFQKSLYVYLN